MLLPALPREPAPERFSLSYRCCLLPTMVLLSNSRSRSLAPSEDRGNKRETPLGGDPGFILTRGSPCWHGVTAHSITAHLATVPRRYQGTWPAPAGRDAARRWFLPGRQRSRVL